MTLRSPKKRPTTVPTFNRRTTTERQTTGDHRLATVATVAGAWTDHRFATAVTLAGEWTDHRLTTVATLAKAWLANRSFGVLAKRLATCALVLGGSAFACTSAVAQTGASSTQPQGWNLRWRKSSQVTPQPVHIPREDPFARPARTAPLVSRHHGQPQSVASTTNRTTTHLATQPTIPSHGTHLRQPIDPRNVPRNVFRTAAVDRSVQQASVANAPQVTPQHSGGVAQTSYVQPVGHNEAVESGRIADANDFFNNPFAETNVPQPVPQPIPALVAPEQLNAPQLTRAPRAQTAPQARTARQNERVQLVQNNDTFAMPTEDTESSSSAAPNTLRDPEGGNPFDSLPVEIPTPDPEPINPGSQDADEMTAPVESLQSPTDATQVEQPQLPKQQTEPSLGDLMKDADDLKPPSPPEELPRGLPKREPAFGLQEDSTMDSSSDLDAAGTPKAIENPFDNLNGLDAEQRRDRMDRDALNQQRSPTIPKRVQQRLSCDEFRERVARKKIDTFSLDISPPFRPDLFNPDEYEAARKSFVSRQKIRDWRDHSGEVIAVGRFVDLSYESLVLENESGEREYVSLLKLGEGDVGYLTENWELPRECLIPQVAYTPRNWAPTTMTWMASNLCSKPRYYEEVNLERYGHTFGPVLQPVVSSAHFFANIAVTPYKMGIHPPNECQYALGYYRPGNCAPWIVPPVPISARGALAQGAFMTGAFWLIP